MALNLRCDKKKSMAPNWKNWPGGKVGAGERTVLYSCP